MTKLIHYRPEIDGLRAVAVFMVIIYHAFPNVYSGGFIGVDVFFVISGYLIAKNISNQIYGEIFSFKNFYISRILRIFPTMLLVVFVVLFVGNFTLLSKDYTALAYSAIAGLFFYENIHFVNTIGYFSSGFNSIPLLHLWSLSVEEQFYLILPFLLYFANRNFSKQLKVIVFCILLSILYSIFLSGSDAPNYYYSAVSRFWELFLGVLLSIYDGSKASKLSSFWLSKSRLNSFASISLLALLLFSGYFISKHYSYPGFLSVAPVASTIGIIAFGDKGGVIYSILASRLFVYFGKISYPMYMWHWPIFVYARKIYGENISIFIFLVCLALTTLLSQFSYVYIEQYIKGRKDRGRIAILMITFSCILALLSYSIIKGDGLPDRYINIMNRDVEVALKFDADHSFRHNECFIDALSDRTARFSIACEKIEHPDRSTVLLWGDSHAASLYRGLEYRSHNEKFNLIQFTASGCPPILGFNVKNRPECLKINNSILSYVKKNKPNIVILSGFWAGYNGLDNGDPNGIWEELDSSKLHFTVEELLRSGVDRIYVIGSLPAFKVKQPDLLIKNNILSKPDVRTYKEFNFDVIKYGNIVKSVLPKDVTFLDPLSVMCNDDGCLLSSTSEKITPISFDYGHLTDSGSIFLIDHLFKSAIAN